MSKSQKNYSSQSNDQTKLECIFGKSLTQDSLNCHLIDLCSSGNKSETPEQNKERIEKVELLLKNGADPNHETKHFKNSPLHLVCRSGDIDIVRMLIDYGANIDAKNNKGLTPIFNACCYNSEEVLRVLLERGCDIDHKDNEGMTPLLYSCDIGSTVSVEILLERGCDIEADDNFGQTPLFLSLLRGDKDISQKLLEEGCNIEHRDKQGCTPVFKAVYMKDTEALRMMIEKGANLDVTNNDGLTFINHALRYGAVRDDEYQNMFLDLIIRKGVKIPSYMEDRVCVKHIRKRIEDERRVSLLLLCTREFCCESIFYKENLPLDLFKIIFSQSF